MKKNIINKIFLLIKIILSDIAVDDIVITKSYCNPFPSQATVSPVIIQTTSTSTRNPSSINSSKKL